VTTEKLTCEDCKHTGPDVEHQQHYIGGRGWKWFTLCHDSARCEQRRKAVAA
jgi:hypothetical protein